MPSYLRNYYDDLLMNVTRVLRPLGGIESLGFTVLLFLSFKCHPIHEAMDFIKLRISSN